ncbi:MAG: alkaline phosphatase family protein [Promethearchaeota archaeon]
MDKIILLGIDGVPFELMKDLAKKDIMPNFKELCTLYTFKPLKSSIPPVSSISWSSIITGCNPGEHGIYGFSSFIPNTYTLSFPNFNALKKPAFWHKFSDKKCAILNVPSTYPVKELNGVHISGFISLDLEKAVYPKKYLPFLKSIDYEIDVDSSLAHKQSKEKFLDELFKVLDIRFKMFKYFWKENKWDIFMPVITGSDRLGHFLWKSYENNKDQYYNRFLEYFEKIDEIIGFFSKKIDNRDVFIILSDHGMENIFKNVNINTYLEEEGVLKLSSNLKKYNRVMKGSKAFVLDPGRVYLNKKGVFPNGTISKEEEKETIEELEKILYELRYKKQKVVKKIYNKNDIYHGDMIKNAPDLVIMENKGFNIKASIGKEKIFEEENIFSGKHNDQAFILINQSISIEHPSVENILNFFGDNYA